MADKHKGLWIAVYGPDGVGKSAVIDQLAYRLATGFRGMSRFHFRPRFRQQHREGAPVTKPHAKPARGTVVSTAKLIYWLADCWWGYLSTIVPRRHAGQVIFYDRYFPDVLVDPVRYRLPASCIRLASGLVALAPRPDLCVLLDASANVVQQRKRELSLPESQRQRIAYLKMFECLQCKLLVNAESTVDEVSCRVATGICSLQTEPFSQPRERSFVPNL